ncbi:MAG TPA: phosphate acyltransferase, partial [Elusimicrobiota bacterium]|nr:phosphate acyltransferase [Elusimicrobiota bacterium]
MLSAASFLAERKIAVPVLLGDRRAVENAATEGGFPLPGVEILDMAGLPDKNGLAQKLFERRKTKGLSLEAAHGLLTDPLYAAAMLLAVGSADGLLAGAVRSTADTVRAAFACLGLARGAETIFGAFL